MIVLQSALASGADQDASAEGSCVVRELAIPGFDGAAVCISSGVVWSQTPLIVTTAAWGSILDSEAGDDAVSLCAARPVFCWPASEVCPKDSVENRIRASQRYCIPVASPG
jgi:hypothetical protein